MPSIPLIQSRATSQVGGIDVRTSAAAAGAGIGAALQQLGGAFGDVASNVGAIADEEKDRSRRESLANRNAQAAPALARASLDAQLAAPADGAGLQEDTYKRQIDYIDKMANEIPDDKERRAFKVQQTERIGSYAVASTEQQYKMRADNSKAQADASLAGLENLVRSDASQYKTAVQDGEAIIDARPGFTAAMKRDMKVEWRNRSAASRFDGAMAAATSTEDFDALASSLAKPKEGDPDWKAELTPEAYDRVLTSIVTAKKAFATQADVQARSALDTLEARNNDGLTIPREELEAAKGVVEQSGNPITAARMSRVARDQQIYERESKLTPTQLRTREQASLNGGSYPELPAELNEAVSEATALFPGVSAGYLGNTLMREYGGPIRAGRGKADPAFRPQAVHAGVDLKGLRPEVSDAVTLAGQILGRPLPVTSGYRSQKKQDGLRKINPGGAAAGRIAKHSNHTKGAAVDISTAGMSPAEKAQAVDALVQAGFTGFGEYGGHIHADLRDSVANNFDPSSGNLGWTKGSAEVFAVLQKRGFASGGAANTIDRSGANLPKSAGVDYSISNPTSTATGPLQFVEGTWLDLIKDGSTAQRIGLDITGKSDGELLELRKNPRIATLMGAALADQNRKALEGGIGRKANDAELYMAHFLGSTGATALVQGYAADGSMAAATLLPAAARANENVFYRKNGEPRSVKEVYDNIASQFESSATGVAYGDAQTYRKMADTAEKQVNDDPMAYARSKGLVPEGSLDDEGGYQARGASAKFTADYFNIPTESMKPFESSEVNAILKQFKDGDADSTLAIMARIQEMDRAAPGMAKAAYAQLGEKDTTLGYAASLAADRGQADVATQIVRGQKMLAEDKTLESAFGSGAEATTAFNETTAGSLMQLGGAERNAIFNAAKAHYAQTYVTRGNFTFDPDTFKQSVQKVLGGEGGQAIDDVNGKPTLLPPGVDGETFNTVIDKMTNQDLVLFSEDGLAPTDGYGDPVTAYEVNKEGEFVPIGANQYKIRMADSGYLVTKGRAYIFVADVEMMTEVATRQPEPSVFVGTPEELAQQRERERLRSEGNVGGAMTLDEINRDNAAVIQGMQQP